MRDVLNQREVDALLSAVEGGQVDLDEVTEEPESEEVAVYDFRRPERFTKESVRALEALHENFARSLGASLSTFLFSMADFLMRVFRAAVMGYPSVWAGALFWLSIGPFR